MSKKNFIPELSLRACPICKKNFIPAPEHAWKIGGEHRALVCSYTCMRVWEKRRGWVK